MSNIGHHGGMVVFPSIVTRRVRCVACGHELVHIEICEHGVKARGIPKRMPCPNCKTRGRMLPMEGAQ